MNKVKYILFKRIITLFMVVCLSFCVVNSDYKTAYATGLEELLPLVGTGVGSLSLGGVIILVLAIVALGLSIELVIDNWDSIVDAFDQWCDDTGGTLDQWIDNLKSGSNIFDRNGDGVISLFDMEKSISNITITPEMKLETIEFVKDYFDYADGIEVGVHNWQTGADSVRIAEGLAYYEKYKLSYPYVTILKDTKDNEQRYRIFMSKTQFMTADFNLGYIVKLLFPIDNSSNSIAWQWVSEVQKFTDKTNYIAINSNTYVGGEYILYSNSNIYDAVLDANSNWQKTNIIDYEKSIPFNYTIQESIFKLKDNVDINTKTTELTVTPELVNELAKVKPTTVKTTEKVIEAIKTADIAAEKNYTDVIDTNIEAPVTVDWLGGMLSGLLDLLKGLLEWLFVPSNVVISDFVTHCETTMENQAGLLTYPLTLVIDFLIKVMQLGASDCILKIPKIEYKGYVLYPGLDFNFTQEIHKSTYSHIYSVYRMITNFIMIIAVLSLAVKKGDEIIRGN